MEIAVDAELAEATVQSLLDRSELTIGHKFALMEEDFIGCPQTRLFDEALHAASWAMVRALDGFAAGMQAAASAVCATVSDITGVDLAVADELSEAEQALELSR